MAQVGQVNLPGWRPCSTSRTRFCSRPAGRNYTDVWYSGSPYVFVELLVKWSRAGEPLRLIVTGTPVNVPVLLGPVRYGEQDGTGDVYVTLTFRQYRELTAVTVEQPAHGQPEPDRAQGHPDRPELHGEKGGYPLGHRPEVLWQRPAGLFAGQLQRHQKRQSDLPGTDGETAGEIQTVR